MPNTGLKYSTAVQDGAEVGQITWATPSNAAGNNTVDAIYASVTSGFGQTISHFLKFTFAHGLASTDVINGIVFAFRRAATDFDDLGLPSDTTIKFIKNGTVSGSNLSTNASWPKDTFAWSANFGGTTQTGGLSLTGSDTVGIALSATFQTTGGDLMKVTAARATFYYTAATAGGLLIRRRRTILAGVIE